MKFLSNLDLTKNQILNVALQNLATNPGSPVEGQIYYNTTDKEVLYFDGTNWASVSGDITAVNTAINSGLQGGATSGAVNLSIKLDGTTLLLSNDGLKINTGGVTADELATDSVTTIKIVDKNITFSKIEDVASMTVIGRVETGSGVTSAISIITDMDNASLTTLVASETIKSYVDETIAAIGVLQGSFDASGTTFPVVIGEPGTVKGDYWYVNVAGNVGGLMTLNVGDVIIARTDDASTTDAADWIALEVNRDQATTTVLGVVRLSTIDEAQTGTDEFTVITPKTLASVTATETRRGLSEIATQSEVNAGTDDERYVTPLKLSTYIDANVGGFSANIGNGVATVFDVEHNLGTTDLIAQLVEVSNGDIVFTDFKHVNINTFRITFAVAPSSNQYRVNIKK